MEDHYILFKILVLTLERLSEHIKDKSLGKKVESFSMNPR